MMGSERRGRARNSAKHNSVRERKKEGWGGGGVMPEIVESGTMGHIIHSALK